MFWMERESKQRERFAFERKQKDTFDHWTVLKSNKTVQTANTALADDT